MGIGEDFDVAQLDVEGREILEVGLDLLQSVWNGRGAAKAFQGARRKDR